MVLTSKDGFSISKAKKFSPIFYDILLDNLFALIRLYDYNIIGENCVIDKNK